MTTSTPYPLTFDVDQPTTTRNRWTTAFRLVLAVPVLVVLGLLSAEVGIHVGIAGPLTFLFLPTMLVLVVRRKYPRWWFDFAVQLLRFNGRVVSYLFLLRDEYPSLDNEQAVHLQAEYPDVAGLNRWLPLVKWILAIPHYIVLAFLYLAAVVVSVVAWFAILFTGRYPRGLFEFVVGVFRWHFRVVAYAFLLTTDRYPPFALR